MWKITKNYLIEDVEGYIYPSEDKFEEAEIQSNDFKEDVVLEFGFKIYDDDDYINFSGFSDSFDDEKAFGPLDDYAQPDSGSTYIKYKNPVTKEWEVL